MGAALDGMESVNTRFGTFRAYCDPAREIHYEMDRMRLRVSGDSSCETSGGVGINKRIPVADGEFIITTEAVTAYAQTVRVIFLSEAQGVKEAVLFGGDPSEIRGFPNGELHINVPGRGFASSKVDGVVGWVCEYRIDFTSDAISVRFSSVADNTVPITVCGGELLPISTDRRLSHK